MIFNNISRKFKAGHTIEAAQPDCPHNLIDCLDNQKNYIPRQIPHATRQMLPTDCRWILQTADKYFRQTASTLRNHVDSEADNLDTHTPSLGGQKPIKLFSGRQFRQQGEQTAGSKKSGGPMSLCARPLVLTRNLIIYTKFFTVFLNFFSFF